MESLLSNTIRDKKWIQDLKELKQESLQDHVLLGELVAHSEVY